nr:hypothetical protein [Candidatus Sigynarchaeota archaeon]
MYDDIKSKLRMLLRNADKIPASVWTMSRHYYLQLNDIVDMTRDGFFFIHHGEMPYRMPWVKYPTQGGTISWKVFFSQKARHCIDPLFSQSIEDLLLFTSMKTVKLSDILHVRPSKIRDELLHQYGYEKILSELKGRTVYHHGNARLIVTYESSDERLKFLKYFDEKTASKYLVRVPSDVYTCQEAMHWILGLKKTGVINEEYILENLDEIFQRGNVEMFSRAENAIRLELCFSLIDFSHIKAQHVMAIRNVELRTRLWKEFGYERLLKEIRNTIVDIHGSSELILFHRDRNSEEMVFLKVIDSTSGRPYLLRVPSCMRKCSQAVAWTFNLSEDDYKPMVEA